MLACHLATWCTGCVHLYQAVIASCFHPWTGSLLYTVLLSFGSNMNVTPVPLLLFSATATRRVDANMLNCSFHIGEMFAGQIAGDLPFCLLMLAGVALALRP